MWLSGPQSLTTVSGLLPRPLNDATGTLESVALKMKRSGADSMASESQIPNGSCSETRK